MTIWLKQSTATTVKFGPLVDAADGITPMTALTIAQADIRLSKNGGNIAQSNNAAGAAHDELGYYDIPLDTTDTNTLGTLRVAVHETGALPVWQDFMVVPANVWDSFFGADALQVHVNEMTAGIITAAAIATNAIDADALAADAIAEINATVDTAISDAALATATNLATVDTVVDNILASLIPAIRKGTAQAGAASTITLDTGASATDDIYNGNWVMLTGGTGAGQSRLVFDYVGSTKVSTIVPNWTTAPSTDSTFVIVPASYMQGVLALSANAVNASALAADAVTEIQSGLATAAALATVDSNVDTLVSSITTTGAIADAVWDEARSAHTIAGTYGESFRTVVSGAAVTGTLSTTQMTTDLTEATDDHLNGRVVIFTSGALLYQATSIEDYDGTTKMITMTALTEAPSAADTFIIL